MDDGPGGPTKLDRPSLSLGPGLGAHQNLELTNWDLANFQIRTLNKLGRPTLSPWWSLGALHLHAGAVWVYLRMCWASLAAERVFKGKQLTGLL